MTYKFYKVVLSLIFLSSCFPTIIIRQIDLKKWYSGKYNITLSTVITQFEPGKGSGSVYNIREKLKFNVNLNFDGYILLIDIDSRGNFSELGRYYIQKGDSILPPLGEIDGFRITTPENWERIRVIYTDKPYPNYKISGQGTKLDDQIAEYFKISNSQIKDVAETYITVNR
jgi:hypothetical protein